MAHIYVVDDDEQLLRMLGLMLERGGHTPTVVNSPIEALEMMTEDPPDMAILDVMMPGMSGHDLCRALRAHDATKHLPIMILTARAQEEDRNTALQGGADDYLSKPVTSQELLSQVDKLLSQQRATESYSVESKVLSVYGLSGGVGRTTVAVNLAAQLRVMSQLDVCLVDFTASGGQAAMHYRIQPRTSWANLIGMSTIDWTSIQANLTAHESGVKLLCSPATPIDPNQLTLSMVEQILRALREHVHFVVVDLPPMLTETVAAALAASDHVVHVVAPNAVSVQTAVRTERAVKAKGIQMKGHSFLLNQGNGDPQLSKATVERGLGTRIPQHLTHDPSQTRAIMQGAPLCLGSGQSSIPLVIQQVASAAWGEPAQI